MSRIGKQPITVPSGVDVTIDGATVRVKGPKGQLEYTLVGDVTVARDGDVLDVTRADDRAATGRCTDCSGPSISNMVIGRLRRVRKGARDRRRRLPGAGARARTRSSSRSGSRTR